MTGEKYIFFPPFGNIRKAFLTPERNNMEGKSPCEPKSIMQNFKLSLFLECSCFYYKCASSSKRNPEHVSFERQIGKVMPVQAVEAFTVTSG
jgi:hypothetical protein